MSNELPDDWSPEQNRVFSRLLRHMEANPAVFTHPDAEPMSAEHWHTVAYNAAWTAAHLMDPDAPYLVHANEEGDLLGAEATPESMQ
jgi:hypothetical protein